MDKFVIDEAFLQRLEVMQSLLQNNIAGMFGGNRRSKNFGSSCEFADFRDYAAGDDVSKIDWNAFARFDALYVKLYLDERQMHTKIYLDTSRSMIYGKGDKARKALEIAAAFAYLSVSEMDKVSIYGIRNSEVSEIIPSMVGKESFISAIGALNDVEFDGDAFLSDAVLPTKVGYGDGMSIIISDFLTDHNYEDAIDCLVGKKRDVACVQILSSEETNPRIRGKSHLFDAEDGAKSYRKNIDRDIIAAYRRALAYVTGRLKDYCVARGANFLFAGADEPVEELFFGKLVDQGVLK